jgi:hypothetical protein
MATDPIAWKVTVNKWFKSQNVNFRPAEVDGPKKGYPRYSVPVAVYNGTTDDGTPFASLCATAEPEYPRE